MIRKAFPGMNGQEPDQEQIFMKYSNSK